MAYPTALPCSGQLAMSEIRDWMIAASEILPGTTQVGLEGLVLSSHLTDKTAPYNISDFHRYAVPSISCGTTYTLKNTYQNYRDIVVGSTSGNVDIDYTVHNDTSGTNTQSVKIEVQYEGGAWVTVLPETNISILSSITGTATYSYTYNSSTTITVRITKVTIIA